MTNLSLNQQKGHKFHDKDAILKKAKLALKNIIYDNKKIGASVFDVDKEMQGWNFISEKIFELPRNDQFVKVLNKRLTEAE